MICYLDASCTTAQSVDTRTVKLQEEDMRVLPSGLSSLQLPLALLVLVSLCLKMKLFISNAGRLKKLTADGYAGSCLKMSGSRQFLSVQNYTEM